MKPKCQAILKKDKYGKWAMLIKVVPVNPKANGDCSMYTMADFDTNADVMVDCDGLMKRPRLILKMHCKLSEQEKNRVTHNKALARARAGSPMLH